jgi:hypothetical protein
MQTYEKFAAAKASPEAVAQGEAILRGVLARSATDMEFRQKLVSEPRTAFAEYTGRDVPESFNVAFVENRADATIVLPHAIDTEAELSEQELETVAGGELILVTLAIATVCVLAIDKFTGSDAK